MGYSENITTYVSFEAREGVEIVSIEDVPTCRMHHLWYGGNVMDIVFNGKTYCVGAMGVVKASMTDKHTGEVLLNVLDEDNEGSLGQEVLNFICSDEDLIKLMDGTHDKYKLEVTSGNSWCLFSNTEDFLQTPADNSLLVDIEEEIYDKIREYDLDYDDEDHVPSDVTSW